MVSLEADSFALGTSLGLICLQVIELEVKNTSKHLHGKDIRCLSKANGSTIILGFFNCEDLMIFDISKGTAITNL